MVYLVNCHRNPVVHFELESALCQQYESIWRCEWHAEERLRTHLRKRHKVRVRYFEYTIFPNNYTV